MTGKFLNAPADALAESLEGFALAHDEVVLNAAPRFIRRREVRRDKVALVAGGGSGHEPLHGGFVGEGMLDAAVPGEVFTSPSPDQILAAAEAVAGPAGLLFIVKNYSGDVMNFEIAAEMLATPSRTVLIGDDVAIPADSPVGRRGVAGTLVVEKIVGAAAERGADLDSCAALAEDVSRRVRSMGVALGGCRQPTADRPNLELEVGQMEMGVGIHGEPGLRRAPATTAAEIFEELGGHVLDDLAPVAGDQVLLFVNGFGGTPLMELYILYREARRLAEARGLTVARSLVGNYVTSLEMPGASLTVARMTDEMIALWDAPVRTPGLRWGM